MTIITKLSFISIDSFGPVINISISNCYKFNKKDDRLQKVDFEKAIFKYCAKYLTGLSLCLFVDYKY